MGTERAAAGPEPGEPGASKHQWVCHACRSRGHDFGGGWRACEMLRSEVIQWEGDQHNT